MMAHLTPSTYTVHYNHWCLCIAISKLKVNIHIHFLSVLNTWVGEMMGLLVLNLTIKNGDKQSRSDSYYAERYLLPPTHITLSLST